MRFSCLLYDGDSPACIGDVETNTIQIPDVPIPDAIELCRILTQHGVNCMLLPLEEA